MDFPVELKSRSLEKVQTLGLRPEDFSEQFVRGGGAGGQKINKTSSCVLLRHFPTGTEVRCQAFREREANRKMAYHLLILKIEAKLLGQASEKAKKIHKLIKQKKRRSRRAQEKVLKDKAHRSGLKQSRQSNALFS